jgi:hypothetical protein
MPVTVTRVGTGPSPHVWGELLDPTKPNAALSGHWYPNVPSKQDLTSVKLQGFVRDPR